MDINTSDTTKPDKSKSKGCKTGCLICFLIIAFVVVVIIGVNIELNKEENSIPIVDNSKTEEYYQLVEQYNGLTQKYNDVTQQNSYLTETNNSLLKERQSLLTEIERTIEEFKNISEGAIVPPYIVTKDRKITFLYRNLDNKIDGGSWDVETLEANTLCGTFMRELSISEMKSLGLSDILKRFTNGSKYVKLGGKFTVVDLRPYIQKDNFTNMIDKFSIGHSDDESEIKEVWNMVTQLCPYVEEFDETPRLPLETLLYGGGDCEDVAILTASILKAIAPSWTVQLVYMDTDNPTKPLSINHALVYVDTGEYKTFVESTNNQIMSPYQIVDGFYIDVQ